MVAIMMKVRTAHKARVIFCDGAFVVLPLEQPVEVHENLLQAAARKRELERQNPGVQYVLVEI